MKLRYYMRGIGICMIVTTLLLGVTSDGKATLTDEEIKARAAQLGMVEEKAVVLSDLKVEEESDETVEVKQENSEEISETGEEISEEAVEESEIIPETSEQIKTSEEIETSEDASEEATEQIEDASVESSEQNENVSEISTEDTEEETVEQTEESTVTLVIKSGASSVSVSKDLAQAGLVSDAGEYDRYLCSNGYDKVIRIGTYEIPVGSSEEEIAKIITGKR